MGLFYIIPLVPSISVIAASMMLLAGRSLGHRILLVLLVKALYVALVLLLFSLALVVLLFLQQTTPESPLF
ncbi:MAG: hypothetical protein DRJ59_06270 [Thermoprotei archaeon]|nr:MAG: hypothetical protein DRJ59_06270 [Thermoprotei archaeon]